MGAQGGRDRFPGTDHAFGASYVQRTGGHAEGVVEIRGPVSLVVVRRRAVGDYGLERRC